MPEYHRVEKAIKKIILSRPAVEAGEKLGFLPGVCEIQFLTL